MSKITVASMSLVQLRNVMLRLLLAEVPSAER